MLFEGAGDQYYEGRILSDMNVLSANFGASVQDVFIMVLLAFPRQWLW